jgi:hypothetical protein
MCTVPAARAADDLGRSLAVSVPADPTRAEPGRASTVAVRVLNPGSSAVTVTITGRGVDLGEDGSVRIEESADPLWRGRVTFPSAPLTIAPDSYQDVSLSIQVPEGLAPDVYFVGFLVTPLRTGGSRVAVINQIGSYVTLDVPGRRVRALRASLDLPGVQVADTASGSLRVDNAGDAVVRFWGEITGSSSPAAGTPEQRRIDPAILPVGRHRSFPVEAAPAWPVALVTMTAALTYPGETEATTEGTVVSDRVLLIHPWVLALVVSLLLGGIAVAARMRRHRRRLAARRRVPRQRRRAEPVAPRRAGAHAR